MRVLKAHLLQLIQDSENKVALVGLVSIKFCLKQLSEKIMSHGMELYMISIALQKTYDSVLFLKLWPAMRGAGINNTAAQ